LGKRIAPPRFVLFVIVFAAGLAIGIPVLGLGRGTMAAFDVAAAAFLTAVSTLLRHGEADRMRRAARDNDANRAVLLGFSFVTLIVVMVAVAGELKGRNDAAAIALVVATLALAWLFSNTIYALHYAHLFYLDAHGGRGSEGSGDAGGLTFPHCDEPDYWDFVYFSYTLGMTFQTSDVEMGSRRMRRVALGQCLAAFVFNLGVLAFSINVLGGGG
jgi:uncharacterized membrane protein